MKTESAKPQDLNSLPKEELDKIQKDLTDKLTKIIEMATSRANKVCEPYGLKATMAWDLKEK